MQMLPLEIVLKFIFIHHLAISMKLMCRKRRFERPQPVLIAQFWMKTLWLYCQVSNTHTHTQLRLNYCLFRYSSRLKCYEIPYLKTKMLKFHCRTRRYKWLQRRLVSVVSDIDRTNVAANWVWFTEAISRLTRCCLVGNLKRLSYCFLHTILSIVYILLAVATSTKEKIGSFTKLCSD